MNSLRSSGREQSSNYQFLAENQGSWENKYMETPTLHFESSRKIWTAALDHLAYTLLYTYRCTRGTTNSTISANLETNISHPNGQTREIIPDPNPQIQILSSGLMKIKMGADPRHRNSGFYMKIVGYGLFIIYRRADSSN